MTEKEVSSRSGRMSLWRKISLRTRLTVISISVIGILLAISLAGTTSFLKTYLQQYPNDGD